MGDPDGRDFLSRLIVLLQGFGVLAEHRALDQAARTRSFGIRHREFDFGDDFALFGAVHPDFSQAADVAFTFRFVLLRGRGGERRWQRLRFVGSRVRCVVKIWRRAARGWEVLKQDVAGRSNGERELRGILEDHLVERDVRIAPGNRYLSGRHGDPDDVRVELDVRLLRWTKAKKCTRSEVPIHASLRESVQSGLEGRYIGVAVLGSTDAFRNRLTTIVLSGERTFFCIHERRLYPRKNSGICQMYGRVTRTWSQVRFA